MAEMTFNLNGIWKCFSQTGNETLSLSVYNGNASIVMFRRGTESNRPVVKMSLSPAACIKLIQILKKLMESQPDTRSPFTQMTFNKESRQYEQATNFVFYKDDKRCYGIEVSNKLNPTPTRFVLKCASTFSTGAESMTDEQKSHLAMLELIQVFEKMPDYVIASRFNMEPPQRGGRGKKGGGGGYRQQSRDPYGSSGSESDNVFG